MPGFARHRNGPPAPRPSMSLSMVLNPQTSPLPETRTPTEGTRGPSRTNPPTSDKQRTNNAVSCHLYRERRKKRDLENTARIEAQRDFYLSERNIFQELVEYYQIWYSERPASPWGEGFDSSGQIGQGPSLIFTSSFLLCRPRRLIILEFNLNEGCSKLYERNLKTNQRVILLCLLFCLQHWYPHSFASADDPPTASLCYFTHRSRVLDDPNW